MTRYETLKDENREEYLEVAERGWEVLHHPLLNKGSAFSDEERSLLKLDGFLPPHVSSMDQQLARVYENYSRKTSPLERHIFLRSLQDRNEVLFYAVLVQHLEEMMPIVYTPTVGEACREYSHIFGSARGVFLSPSNIDRASEILSTFRDRGVELIVATDSEAILGIGDQGAGGMGIPIGKLSLYVAGAGLHPATCLPITLDVGTNRRDLLEDPLYLGIRQERLRGEAYFAFMDQFVTAVKEALPGALLQWEDFSKQNAFSLLARYRKELPSFNDDIQGTGAVTLAGTLAAVRLLGQRLEDQSFAVYGAGAGGGGVAHQLYLALQSRGLSADEAKRRVFVLDSRGLLVKGRGGMEPYKEEFTTDSALVQGWQVANPDRIDLLEVIRNGRPTVLYGFSGTPSSFTREMIAAMLQYTDHPIVFPLSNPTDMAEAIPEELYEWSSGRAIVATGSPFEDVVYQGKRFRIGQGNNAFVFPGVGLGALAVKAREITEEMFVAAAEALPQFVSAEDLQARAVYPPIAKLREVCKGIAVAVARQAIAQGVAPALSDNELEAAVSHKIWEPHYVRFRAAQPAMVRS